MNEARLQQVLGKGYAIAAERVGGTFELYRPSAADSVIVPINMIAASFKAGIANYGGGFKFDKPDTHKDHYNNGLLDTRIAQKFDYLVADRGTWFVAQLEPIKPCLLVRCDRIISVLRPGSGVPCGAVGLADYGGTTASSEVALMEGWPAALFDTGGKARGLAGLPVDVGAPSVEIMLPSWDGVLVRPSDFVTDDLGRRYTIKGAELTTFGWKIMAVEAVA